MMIASCTTVRSGRMTPAWLVNTRLRVLYIIFQLPKVIEDLVGKSKSLQIYHLNRVIFYIDIHVLLCFPNWDVYVLCVISHSDSSIEKKLDLHHR